MSRPVARWLVALLVLVDGVLLLRPLLSDRGSRSPASLETAAVSTPPPREIVDDTLGRGETLAQLMADRGLLPSQIHEFTQLVGAYRKPRSLRPGVLLRLSGAPGASPDQVELQLNADSILHFTASDSAWAARLEVVPFVVDTVRLSGVIESSLWLAKLGGDVDRLPPGGFEELVYDLADVYAWKVDFTRDVRAGDGFRVAYERKVRPDGSVRSRRFLAVELRNQGRALLAIPYPRPGGRVAYFDAEGRSLRGAFLRYPVPYRITSGFTRNRFHPVLKRNRPHQGIDYGAPHGTRVQATASGTVARAGVWGGYGKMVEIRHRNGIRTRYAHLSAIAPGARPGKRVEQGQWIGRVGATGLASGTHLHYEFLQGGFHRNPLKVHLPAEPSLEKEALGDFHQVRDGAVALLDPLAIPTLESLADAGAEDPSGTR